MEYVYHGSKVHDLKELTPHQSTHGNYVYASNRVIATVFANSGSSDLTTYFGRNEKSKPWNLVERVPGVFDKIFSNSFSLYTLDASDFIDIHTGFDELVSDHPVKVLNEEKYDNVFDAIIKLEDEEFIKIYRYPERPEYLKEDDSDLLEKIKRSFLRRSESERSIYSLTRAIFLHPNLEDEINEFAYGLGYELPEYEEIKEFYIKRQEEFPNEEFFVDEALEMKKLMKSKTR